MASVAPGRVKPGLLRKLNQITSENLSAKTIFSNGWRFRFLQNVPRPSVDRRGFEIRLVRFILRRCQASKTTPMPRFTPKLTIVSPTHSEIELGFSHVSMGFKPNGQTQWEWQSDAVELLDNKSTGVNLNSVGFFSQYLRLISSSYSSTEVPTDYSGETVVATEAADFFCACSQRNVQRSRSWNWKSIIRSRSPQNNPGGIGIRPRVNLLSPTLFCASIYQRQICSSMDFSSPVQPL